MNKCIDDKFIENNISNSNKNINSRLFNINVNFKSIMYINSFLCMIVFFLAGNMLIESGRSGILGGSIGLLLNAI